MPRGRPFIRETDSIETVYDVAVVGAGPGGCAVAASHAAEGASVLLLEANPDSARRFAGEWIHPPGLQVLRSYGLLKGFSEGAEALGFMVLANDGLGPIALPYATGSRGRSCDHGALVRHLRREVGSLDRVDYVEGVRALAADARGLDLLMDGRFCRVRAARVVIAAGRSSARLLRADKSGSQVSISKMVGFTVAISELSFEGHGHVIVGGPSPALAYRVSHERVRLCIDVPDTTMHRGEVRDWLWKSFAEVLPSPLRRAVARNLPAASLAWAANAFRPRRYRNESGVALVGDAAGIFHPLTAMGMTMAVLDARALATASTLDAYAAARDRQSHVPELLSNAIYLAFRRQDEATLAIRDAIFRTWRSSPEHRRRTMDLLSGASTRRIDFVRAFSKVALRAGAEAASADPSTMRELATWLRWPVASLHPSRAAMRSRSRDWVCTRATEPEEGVCHAN